MVIFSKDGAAGRSTIRMELLCVIPGLFES